MPMKLTRRSEDDPADPIGDQRPILLDDATVEAIARRVCELIAQAETTPSSSPFMTAQELALRLGRKRSWVYANADHLGALRLGTGPRPRLMFDLSEVEARLRKGPGGASPPRPRRPGTRGRSRRARIMPEAELLPIGPPPPRQGREDGT